MANTAKITGFRPVKYLNGAPWTGQCRKYVIPASDAVNTMVGDLVIPHTTGSDGLQACQRAITGGAGQVGILGVIVGIDPIGENYQSLDGNTQVNLTAKYRPASTKAFVWVVDDPNVLFESSFDAGGTQASVADVGANYAVLIAAGNTTTGTSGMECDVSTKATTIDLQLRLIEMVRRPDNDMTDLGTGQRGIFLLNTHIYGTVAGRGVGLA